MAEALQKNLVGFGESIYRPAGDSVASTSSQSQREKNNNEKSELEACLGHRHTAKHIQTGGRFSSIKIKSAATRKKQQRKKKRVWKSYYSSSKTIDTPVGNRCKRSRPYFLGKRRKTCGCTYTRSPHLSRVAFFWRRTETRTFVQQNGRGSPASEAAMCRHLQRHGLVEGSRLIQSAL